MHFLKGQTTVYPLGECTNKNSSLETNKMMNLKQIEEKECTLKQVIEDWELSPEHNEESINFFSPENVKCIFVEKCKKNGCEMLIFSEMDGSNLVILSNYSNGSYLTTINGIEFEKIDSDGRNNIAHLDGIAISYEIASLGSHFNYNEDTEEFNSSSGKKYKVQNEEWVELK